MRVTTSKSKNSESFYISKGYVNNKGVSTSVIVRKLGTLKDLLGYIAIKKNGSMTVTIRIADTLEPRGFFASRYNGTPTIAAIEKKISCRFVRFNATFVLTLVRSFGTGTYAIGSTPFFSCPSVGIEY